LIQLHNTEIDEVWAATQAQADLLMALGAPPLVEGMPGTNCSSPDVATGNAAP
jgi:cobalt-zinc-cadmium efflux system outer membrane protein